MHHLRCCRLIVFSFVVLWFGLLAVAVPPCFAKGKKDETKKHVVKKSESKKFEAQKTQAKKTETKKTEAKRTEAKRTGPVKLAALKPAKKKHTGNPATLRKSAQKRSRFFDAQACNRYSGDIDDIPNEYEEMISEYLGTPYRRGGTGNSGIDCSGLSRRFYLEVFGLDLPHNSYEQSRLSIFQKIPLNPHEFESSDLLFFKNDKKPINHVGIYLTDGKFIHATPKDGVIISSLDEAYWRQNLVASRRIKDTVLGKSAGAVISSVPDEPGELSTSEISLAYAAAVGQGMRVNLETFYSNQNRIPSPKNHIYAELYPKNPFYRNAPPSESWQGLRASADFNPANWLRITPSLGMLDGPSLSNDVTDNSWQVYGLDAAVSPLSSRWSLALSYRSLLNDGFFTAYQDVPDSDIGLNLNYRVSDAMHFSVLGSVEGYGPWREPRPNAPSWNLRNVSFNLNLSF